MHSSGMSVSRDPSLCSGLGERILCDLDAIRSELSDMP